MFNKIKNHEWSIALCASILPLIFTIFWLLKNTQLPGNDASNYLMSALEIHQYFTDHSFLSGLIHSFTVRGWRPIFFPVFAVPFLVLFHGDLYLSYVSVAILSILFSVIYIYLFLRLKLDKFSALIASSVVALLPLIQAQALMFYAEGPLFVCLLGSIYHLIQSNYFSNKKHVIGFVIFFSLALMIRPVEAVTDLIFVMLSFVISGWYKNIFSLTEIINLFLLIALSGFIFFLFTAYPYLHGQVISSIDGGGELDKRMTMILKYCLLAFLILVVSSLLLKIFCKFKVNLQEKNNNASHFFIPAFAAIFCIVLIWFLPFSNQTFQWIYRTSIGDVANSTGALNGSQFSTEVLYKYIWAEGILCVFTITLVAVMAFLTNPKQRKIFFSAPILYLLLTIPFPFWEVFYTVQIVTRKLSFVFPALLMVLLMIGLQRGRSWSLRIGIITTLLIVQFSLLIFMFAKPQKEKPIFNYSIGYFIPQPSFINPNPHNELIKFLNEQSKIYHLHNIALEVNPGTPDARHPVDAEPIDPFLLSTMIMAERKQYSTSYPYFSIDSLSNLKNLYQRYDAIFLSDSENNMQISTAATKEYMQKYQTEISPSLKTFYYLLHSYSSNELNKISWKIGPCLIMKTQKNGNYYGCLLLKVLR